jgi:hypothetical protein
MARKKIKSPDVVVREIHAGYTRFWINENEYIEIETLLDGNGISVRSHSFERELIIQPYVSNKFYVRLVEEKGL